MEQHKIRFESRSYRSLLEIVSAEFNNVRGNWHITAAIAGSLILHGILACFSYFFFPKYAEPTPRAVTPDILRADFVRLQSKENKETDLREQPATEREMPSLVERVPRGVPDTPPIQALAAKPAQEELNPEVVNQFLTIDEVDAPAMPVGDWVIDYSEWPPGRVPALIVEMWISATGKLEHWRLVGDVENRQIAESSLRLLANTPINPARLNGQPVASFRRIELMIEIEP